MKKKRDCRNVNKGRQNKEKEEEMPSKDNTKKRRKDRGKREEVDLEIWGRKITIFFFFSSSIYLLAETRYLSRYRRNGSDTTRI